MNRPLQDPNPQHASPLRPGTPGQSVTCAPCRKQPKTQFAVVLVSNGEPIRTLAVTPSIRQAKTIIKNHQFLDDYSDLRIYTGTSALDWKEVLK